MKVGNRVRKHCLILSLAAEASAASAIGSLWRIFLDEFLWVKMNPSRGNGMLKNAQKAVRKISGDYHKKWVTTSTFFHSLITEQLGQVAHSYIHGGRYAKDLEVDIADVILCCLAYLNWLDKDASAAFEKSLRKHRQVLEGLKRRK